MKKTLIALAGLAAMAAAGTASAQSSVQLFGIVDATLAYGKGGVSNKTQLTNSGYNSSRLGFRGTEDLGGGLAASFWLEAGVNNDNGTGSASNVNNQGTPAALAAGTQGLTFNRRSTVSLSGGFGELRLGRDYTPQFSNLTTFDPYGTNGVGTTQTLNTPGGQIPGSTGGILIRASNSIAYFLPGNLGGLYGTAMYYMGENNQNGAANENDGEGAAFRIGYAAGPLNIALAMSKTKYAAATLTALVPTLTGKDVQLNNIGAQWDFGVAQIMGHYTQDSYGDVDGKGWLVGALVPVGAGQIRIAYSEYKLDVGADPTAKKAALGYVHNLSKRTALYATFAKVKNSGGSAQALNGAAILANQSSTGYDFGIRHSF